MKESSLRILDGLVWKDGLIIVKVVFWLGSFLD